MKETPKVSVLIPCYNSEKFVEEAVKSIMNQTYKNIEIIIIDDGSTDETLDILERLKKTDSRIKIYKHKKNLGIVKSLNKGLKLCKGKYIARMDADDISLPERLEKQVSRMEASHDLIMCGTMIKLFGDGRIKRRSSPTTYEDIVTTLFKECGISHPTIMLRKDALIEYNIQYQECYYSEDYKLYTDLVAIGKVENLPDCLLLYRVKLRSKSNLHDQNFWQMQGVAAKDIRRNYTHQFLLSLNIDYTLPKIIDVAPIVEIKKIEKSLVQQAKNNKELALLRARLNIIRMCCFMSLDTYNFNSLFFFLKSFDYCKSSYTIANFLAVLKKHFLPSSRTIKLV